MGRFAILREKFATLDRGLEQKQVLSLGPQLALIAELLVETLVSREASSIYGVAGALLNGITDSIRRSMRAQAFVFGSVAVILLVASRTSS
jgi:hypothetical protein